MTITEIDERINILFQEIKELLADEKESVKKTLAEIESEKESVKKTLAEIEQSRGKINV